MAEEAQKPEPVEIPQEIIDRYKPKKIVRVHLRTPEGHPGQMELCRRICKNKIVRAGRRGGKTTGAGIIAVEAFLGSPGVPPKRVLYAAPTIDQVQKFWEEVKRSLHEMLAWKILYKNETKHIISRQPLKDMSDQMLAQAGEPRIRAKTAFNAQTLRGDYADLLILDEYQMMDETAWEEVGAPMLMDHNGDVVFIYTPPSLESKSASKAKDPQHAAKLFKKHKDDPDWLCIHFPSMENPHISAEGIEQASRNMTALAYRQEILAEDTEEIPGALWTRKILEDSRVDVMPCESRRIVIGIDPSGGNVTEVGIVVAAEGVDGHIYVLEDATMKAPRPRDWAQRAIRLYETYQADRIIAERNYGGDMVEETIRTVDERVSYHDVSASRGKLVRAEPVLAMFQKNTMHLVRSQNSNKFAELEEELCVPGDTLIMTDCGELPICTLREGDHVLTRQGLRQIKKWYANGLCETIIINAAGRELECTPNHPIFVLGKGFVRADNIRRGDRVLICQFPLHENTLYSKVKNTFSAMTATIKQAARKVASYSTVKNGKCFADRFRRAFISTIIKESRIIGFVTYDALAPVSINGCMEPLEPSLNHQKLGAGNESRNGLNGNPESAFADSVGQSFNRAASIHGSARNDVNMMPAIVEGVKQGKLMPVYNLSVDQDEEYFANGILTHNCSYTAAPGQKSPNRLDAMVWCGIELSGQGSLGLLDLFKSGKIGDIVGRQPVRMTPVSKVATPTKIGVMVADQTPCCPNCKQVTCQVPVPGGGQMLCNHCSTQYGKQDPGAKVGFKNLPLGGRQINL
jgi:hypothetical protein